MKAVFPRMLLHHAIFRESCSGLAFVTNAGIDTTLSEFLEVLAASADISLLPVQERNAFDQLARSYGATEPTLAISHGELFAWLRGLTIHKEQGQLENADAALLEISDLVVNYSEIDLGQRQAKQIARDIVSQVRAKVAHTTTVVPATDDQLRRDKGIVVGELLSVLSLSTEAYLELKAGAVMESVKTLSRLQRFCEKHGFSSFIVDFCRFKARWDVWRTIERHSISAMDYMLLEDRAQEVLRGNLSFERVVAEARDIAKQFGQIGLSPLKPEEVMGLILSAAASAEAQS